MYSNSSSGSNIKCNNTNHYSRQFTNSYLFESISRFNRKFKCKPSELFMDRSSSWQSSRKHTNELYYDN